jgi:hypothetical protein
MRIDHLFEPLHPTVIHCIGVPGSSRDFFINCLAHHPAIHLNLGEHYLFNTAEEQVLFLSRQIAAQQTAGINNTVTTNTVKIPGPLLLEHCANRKLLTVAASNSVESFDQIHELYSAARIVMVRATVDYLGIHADQYDEQGLLMEKQIGNYALQIDSDRFLDWESFLTTWQWTVRVLALGPVNDSVVSSLQQFHNRYVTTRSNVVPAQA